jgi:hypothetical protein
VPIKSVLAPLRYALAPPTDGALVDESRLIAGLPYSTSLPDENYAPYVAICNRCLVIDPLKRPSATHLAQRLAELPEASRAREAAAAAAEQQQSRRSSPLAHSHDDLLGVQLSSRSSSTASLTRMLHGGGNNSNDDDSGAVGGGDAGEQQQQQQQYIVAGSSGGRIRNSAERISEK